jgi:hypothetical protein
MQQTLTRLIVDSGSTVPFVGVEDSWFVLFVRTLAERLPVRDLSLTAVPRKADFRPPFPRISNRVDCCFVTLRQDIRLFVASIGRYAVYFNSGYAKLVDSTEYHS